MYKYRYKYVYAVMCIISAVSISIAVALLTEHDSATEKIPKNHNQSLSELSSNSTFNAPSIVNSDTTELSIGESVKTGDPSFGAEVTVNEFRSKVTPAEDDGNIDLSDITLVAVKVTIKNIGTTVLTDENFIDPKMDMNIYANGTEVQLSIGAYTVLEPRMIGYRLQMGQAVTAWVPFSIPVNTVPDMISLHHAQDEIGTWVIPTT